MGGESEGFLQHRRRCERSGEEGARGTPGTPLRDDADAGEITEEGLEVLVTLTLTLFFFFLF